MAVNIVYICVHIMCQNIIPIAIIIKAGKCIIHPQLSTPVTCVSQLQMHGILSMEQTDTVCQ